MSIDQLRDVKLITALITPFHEDGSINYDALPDLIEHLLAHHTEALLLAGTTAESPTLTHDEELELFAAVQKDCQWSCAIDCWCRYQRYTRLYRVC